MNNKKKNLILMLCCLMILIILVMITRCSNNINKNEKATNDIASTPIATVTSTSSPTIVLTNTPTITPTNTVTPTLVMTITPTITIAPTATPTPIVINTPTPYIDLSVTEVLSTAIAPQYRKLNKYMPGAGPNGKETYYNLPMHGVLYLMRQAGYSEEEYPYWIREDGVKMFGNYVMCGANFYIRPRGTILETTMGTAMVCDTGLLYTDPTDEMYYLIDIATTW